MHFKKKIKRKVYKLYLNNVCLEFIAFETNLTVKEVEEIIDYMNEIYN